MGLIRDILYEQALNQALEHLRCAQWHMQRDDDVQYVFAMCEIGEAIRQLGDCAVGFWLVKEDFYQMSVALARFQDADRRLHFIEYLGKAVARVEAEIQNS